jgi:hypothetical protein
LYDLRNDPLELRNLAGEPGYEAIIREMSSKIWTFARSHGDVCVNAYIMVGLAAHGPGVVYENS